MNLNALKNFAPAVRRQLIEAVGRKLDFVLTGDTPDLRDKATQRSSIKGKSEKDRPGLIERVAYTWFNRLAALRFLDARGWHPFLCRVLTPVNAGETQAEILKLTRNGALPAELGPFADTGRINDLLDGRIPSTDPQGEVYRHLVLAACRYYHNLMPFLFEALDDETELLLPDDLLTEHSVAQGFRSAMTDDDCAEVEIIGWLYQFYISEKKDDVFDGLKKNMKITPENIPAATQLFTPHWIVKYLVENSLGRLWMLNRPNSRLAGRMDYYIKPERPETEFLKISKPQEIKVCDPASGSGHMLVYGFDILYFIYEEEGYEATEIPHLILENNLYGIEIDERAGELAALALTMKARQYDKRFFSRKYENGKTIEPNICVLQNISFEAGELKAYMEKVGQDFFNMSLLPLIYQFEEADNFGSLIRPAVTSVTDVLHILDKKKVSDNLFLYSTHERVLLALKQADYLSPKYHVVIANPPYMGNKSMNMRLSAWLKDNYPFSKTDLFAAFMERNSLLGVSNSYVAMITQQSWMFLASLESLRTRILKQQDILSLIQIGFNSFPELNSKLAIACAFVLLNSSKENIGTYFDLNDAPLSADKNLVFLSKKSRSAYFHVRKSVFEKIPGSPIAYWISEKCRDAFELGTPIHTIATPRAGMITGNNESFVRLAHEVNRESIGFNLSSREQAKASLKKWFPYQKGGPFRKYYGNNEYVVDWENDGYRLRTTKDQKGNIPAHAFNEDYIFKKNVNWSSICLKFSCRITTNGFLFDASGSAAFPENTDDIFLLASFLNSYVSRELIRSINPSLNFQVWEIGNLPIIDFLQHIKDPIINSVIRLNELAKSDWNQHETSWDFKYLPLFQAENRQTALKATYKQLSAQWKRMTLEMKQLEEENNRIFIDAYGLQDELPPYVPLGEITLMCNPHYRYSVNKSEEELESLLLADTLKEFISYAVGCMMGRYSLDKPGLILADAGNTVEHYLSKIGKPLDQLTFAPDDDGILPVLDGEWFEDDIVSRTRDFLRATFGEATLEENLRFIEESLGKDLRKYFLTDFYKDHLQTYKKRPIYWLFQSPKKGFSALIYLHRYTRDTVNVLLNSYLRDYLHKLRARIEHLEHVQTSSESAREKTAARKESDALKKTLHECEEYEREIILPLAQQRIELDLDDGVKVNYLKFGKALAPVPGLAAKEED